jgi:hypothetical protein
MPKGKRKVKAEEEEISSKQTENTENTSKKSKGELIVEFERYIHQKLILLYLDATADPCIRYSISSSNFSDQGKQNCHSIAGGFP